MGIGNGNDASPSGSASLREQHSAKILPANDIGYTSREISSSSGAESIAEPLIPLDVAPPSSSPMENPHVQRAIHFIATATPGTLTAVGVGLAAVTFVIFGRLGLILIGAFGGIAAFVAWEARHPEVARAVRGEKGPDVIERIWSELKELKTPEDDRAAEDNEEYVLKAFDDFRSETREALSGLVDAVIRDYVRWWYNPIIPTDHSFSLACRKTLTSYLLSISNHLYRKRPADAFLDFLTNSSSMVIVFMSELAAAFASLPPDTGVSAVDAVYNYLADNPDSRLASLLDQKQQAAKFKLVAEDMLGFLERSSYNCDPARVFLREIFANSILETTLQTCSKAEWINEWIVYLLEAGEPDLSQAIDVGMQSGRESGGPHLFSDIDGNVGNVSVAKPARGSKELERGRRKESLAHRKNKLSKADEELEEAMEEMKRMNAMIARDDARRVRDSSDSEPREGPVSSEPPNPTTTLESNAPKPSVDEERLSQNKYSPPGTSTDGFSSNQSEVVTTPVTPRSVKETVSDGSPPSRVEGSQLTSFDQIGPHGQEEKVEDEAPRRVPLTLHNASFTLHDDTSRDGGKIRSKPIWDYLIQVEPSVAGHSGWMIVRKYADFETLHEIMRRIAVVSGASAFTELHKELPRWKIHTRESLRGELERYLRDACWYQSLAESEGMKRFLEKSQGHSQTQTGKNFGWETVGKNMLDVLTIAPKGAMEGGKTLVGGVSGVFGSLPGLNRKSTPQSTDMTPSSSRISLSTPPLPRMDSSKSPSRSERTSIDSQRSSVISTQPGKMAPMERRPSCQSLAGDVDMDQSRGGRLVRTESYTSTSASARPSREHSRASSLAPVRSPSSTSIDQMKLPPPPDEISDDYGSPISGRGVQAKCNETGASLPNLHRSSLSVGNTSTTSTTKKVKPTRQYSQLSEQETRVAVELLFAVINEMYTLSSAWNIRRTLLAAAKSFLLRPGNPSLLTVQNLMQSSVIEANTSDAGIAHQLRRLRENTMPTDEERAAWPEEMTAAAKEKLGVKARKLLIQSGVPAALMGVMGQAATGEALGRVFDCLQIEEVARGLIFGLMLQTIRIMTH